MSRKATKLDELEERSLLAEMARRYYRDPASRRSQQAIAKEFNISQAEFSRCLRRAWEVGIIRVDIDPAGTVDLSGELRRRFPHVRDVRLVGSVGFGGSERGLVDALGHGCAEYFLELTRGRAGAGIGLSCGGTVQAFVRHVAELERSGTPGPTGCCVYPLTMLAQDEIVAITPAALVINMIAALPNARGMALQLPRRSGSGRGYGPDVERVIQKTRHLDFYVVGIGTIDYEGRMRRQLTVTHEFNSLVGDIRVGRRRLVDELRDCDAVGEIAYQPFDSNGRLLVDLPALRPLRENMAYLSLKELRDQAKKDSVDVIAVAGGRSKVKAIHAALKAKFFNVLVCDDATVAAVLKEEGVGG